LRSASLEGKNWYGAEDNILKWERLEVGKRNAEVGKKEVGSGNAEVGKKEGER
jgi:hypothetical protein